MYTYVTYICICNTYKYIFKNTRILIYACI